MSRVLVKEGVDAQHEETMSSAASNKSANILTRVAAWTSNRDIPFWVLSVGMIVMLLWAGSFKMTAPGAEGIIPLVSHSPLISWHFKVFGPYIGSDLIGLTEWLSAVLIIAGYFKPRAGILGGFVGVVIFFTTSTMLLTTPGAVISVPGIPGMRYMSFLGLFLFKDVISLGASFYLISYFGKRAIHDESKLH